MILALSLGGNGLIFFGRMMGPKTSKKQGKIYNEFPSSELTLDFDISLL
jgi:hypothetical protein